ncbi:rhodanese-like domain-containing protein [Marinobacter sp. F4206]|uniref:rhodanese-like domain-containing protein n=1 Tax=Marinobacter sp. F4206 TaxID=2861777 RepID=UPI0035B5057D
MNWRALSRFFLFWSVFVFSSGAWAETVWIDVRGVFEHVLDNIEGDIRISHDDIVGEVSEQFPDKTTEIHLYCASGTRASMARKALIEAGYENVWNEGGIDDARKARGLEQ